MMLDNPLGYARLKLPHIGTKFRQAFQEVCSEVQAAVMGIWLSERGFAAHDRSSVVAAAGDGVIQDFGYACPGYDLGRPVEIELACESLF